MNLNNLKPALLMLVMAVAGCQHCPFGQEVLIPSSDTTPPSVVMDLHFPNGTIVTVTPAFTGQTVNVPGGGRVTVIVKAADGEGVRDAQIWAASITTRIDPNTGVTTRSGPGLLGAPTASNPDRGTPGQNGCTERVASQNLDVRRGATGSVSFEVTARGLNFGGQDVRTPTITLQAQ